MMVLYCNIKLNGNLYCTHDVFQVTYSTGILPLFQEGEITRLAICMPDYLTFMVMYSYLTFMFRPNVGIGSEWFQPIHRM